MAGTELTTFNAFKNTLASRQGFFIIYCPSEFPDKQTRIYHILCSLTNPCYVDMLDMVPDLKLDVNEVKYYHYDSLDDAKNDHPLASFFNM